MEKEKRNKVLIPSIIIAVVILLIISITLGLVFGLKPAEPKWGDWTITAPTEDGTGQVVRNNDKGEKEIIELPKLDDERYIKTEVVAPTYDDTGKQKYTITIDGVQHSFEVTTPTIAGVISFVVNGSKIDSTISHKKDDTVSDDMISALISDTNYDSYTVYTDATLLTEVKDVDAYVKDKANLTLYIVENYAVTFNSDGGSNVETRLIPHGTMYGKLAIPTKPNYEFVGWYDGDKKVEANDTVKTGNHELKAVWIQDCFVFTLDSTTNEYTVVGLKEGKQPESIVIPDTYKGKPVTIIGAQAFNAKSFINSVTLGANIKTIGVSAFSNCSNLNSMTIPKSVEKIEDNAFCNCTKLNTVIFEEGSKLAAFGTGAFKETGIQTIDIPDVVTVIPQGLFYSCTKLESVELPVNLTEIGVQAFAECSKLKSVDLPSKVTTISDYAFQNCTGLEQITLPERLEIIGKAAFDGCNNGNFTSILIPKSVTNIDDSAFAYASNLTIYAEAESKPENWHIDWNISNRPVFWGYDGLDHTYTFNVNGGVDITSMTDTKAITLPAPTKEGYKFLGWYEDQAMSGLTKYDAGAQYYNNKGATLYAKWELDGTLLYIPILNDNEEEVAYSVKANPHNKPTGTIKIENIYGLPVTTIVADGFKDCIDITEIIIPTSVTTIGARTFAGCTKAFIYTNHSSKPDGWDIKWNPDDRPVIWDYDEQIYTYHFVESDGTYIEDLSSDKAITLPAPTKQGYEFLGWYEDAACEGPTVYDAGTKYYKKGGTKLYAKWQVLDFLYTPIYNTPGDTESGIKGYSVKENPENLAVGDIEIPSTYKENDVIEIESRAFDSNTNITSVILPNTITTINEYAFNGCSALTIYAEVYKKPSNWSKDWNPTKRPVIWGYDGREHTYSFNVKGGVDITSMTDTKAITLPAPTKEGYKFLGWYEDQAMSGPTKYDAGAQYYNNKGATLYAKWKSVSSGLKPTPDKLFIDGGIVFNLNEGVSGDVIIPSTYKGQPVTTIYPTTIDYSKVNMVFIPNSVTTIEAEAFPGATNLLILAEAESKPEGWAENWDAGNCLVKWGFDSNTQYKYIFDTNGGNKIDNIEAKGLIILPDAVKSEMILDGWYENSNLTGTKYNFGDKYFNKNGATLYAKWVPVLDKLSFTYCPEKNGSAAHYSVKAKDDTISGHVRIPEKFNDKIHGELFVTEIEDYGFTTGDTDLVKNIPITSIYIPASIEVIPTDGTKSAFVNNKHLRKIVFADGCKVKKIGGNSFANCRNLETVILHEGLEIISETSFSYCDNLKTVYIPSSVTEICVDSFTGYNPENTHFYVAATAEPEGWAPNWHGGIALPENIHYGESKPIA